MPPRVKINKQEIIQTAIETVRKKGASALNARNLARELGCSTQPIFSNFKTMDDLQKDVVSCAYERYLSFIQREVESEKYPVYKAFGMAYIRFAEQEKELFKLLFMCDKKGRELLPTQDFEASVEMIMQANALTKEQAELMHLEMWACVHGIATMLATSFLSFDWELISRMLTDVYQGVRAMNIGKRS